MINGTDINHIILNLIYKISSFKTEIDLLNLATPEILDDFNCSSGIVLNFNDFEEKVSIPEDIKYNSTWLEIKIEFIEAYKKNPFNFRELKYFGEFFYAFSLSTYGLLILKSNKPFEEIAVKEIYNFSNYFGKILFNSVLDFEQFEKDKITKQQLRLQDILVSISTEHISADLSVIDELIMKSLKQIGEFVEADRSYIFSYDFENNTTSNTHEWCAEGITTKKNNLQNIPVDFIKHWLDFHQKGEAFCVEEISPLPFDGEYDLSNILQPQGIKSFITIPKINDSKLIGFVGFDSVKKINKYSEEDKKILFIFAKILVNIKHRKENEERIKDQEKKKEELLQRLATNNEDLSEYAHVVSHDLKAPLRNVNTLINWIIEDNINTLDENTTNSLNQVLFNVEKMDLLIKGILDYSAVDKLESEDRLVDFNNIIDDIKRTLYIPSHIEIKINNNLPKIYGNTLRYSQLFQNLIQNAINYNDKEKGLIEIGVSEYENHFEFYVKDNGIGIAKAHYERIFKVFTKLESKGQSSGIGLSIVKKIIHFYKGEIWLKSQENNGTTFFFTLTKNHGTT